MAKRKKIKNIYVNILVLFVTIILCFFFLEIFARFYFEPILEYPKYAYENDPYRDFKLTENFDKKWKTDEFTVDFKISSMGLRDREYEKKEPNEIRIILLGDSFIFGQGVNSADSLPKQLEKKLNSERTSEDDPKYSVINAGIPGYGTDNIYNYLIHGRLYELEPDMVILGFYEGNDFHDNLGHTDLFVYRGYKVHKSWKGNKLLFLRYMLYKSALITNLYVKSGNARKDKSCETIRNNQLQVYMTSKNDITKKAYSITEELLVNISDELRAKRIPFVVFTHGIMLLSEEMTPCINEKEYGVGEVYSFINKIGKKHNFSVISVHDKLMELDNPGKLFLEKDGHWSVYGNDVVSTLLKQKMYEEGILEERGTKEYVVPLRISNLINKKKTSFHSIVNTKRH